MNSEIDEHELLERIFQNEEACRRITRLLDDKEIADAV
jgi:hypothetical protein